MSPSRRSQNAAIGKIFLTSALCLLAWPARAYVPGRFYATGHTSEKVIALTFDDGPGPITPTLLNFLKDHHIRATFFMEGTQVERYASWVREVAGAGHEIGNHTYMHFDYHKLKNATPDRLLHELSQTESALRRALHNPDFRTHVVRMPYGYTNRTWLLPTLKDKGYALVNWTCDEEGHPNETAQEMATEYLMHARPGAVFLFHDGGRHREKTLAAVTQVVDALEKQGYRFVPAEEMFKN
jgi:peptidoglycan/xylan/chitin deacetylase (PgdA/CDA1 family)